MVKPTKLELTTRTPDRIVGVWRDGLTKLELGWLEGIGYQVPIYGYGKAIIKKLRGETDSRSVKALYGVNEGRFRLGIWDGT